MGISSHNKPNNRKWLISHLDYVFSRYRRFKLSENGKTKCFFCSYPYRWDTMDNMHFRNRDNMCTRWDEENCYPGCRTCHQNKGEDDKAYGELLDIKFGEGFADKLRLRSNQTCKFSNDELLEKINNYERQLTILAKEK